MSNLVSQIIAYFNEWGVGGAIAFWGWEVEVRSLYYYLPTFKKMLIAHPTVIKKYYYFPTLTAVLSKGKNSRLNCSNNSKNKSKANFSSST